MKIIVTSLAIGIFCITINACTYNPERSKGGDSVMNYKPNSVSPADTLNPTIDSTMELDTTKH